MKAQISVDFIMIFSVALIIFLFLFSIVSKRNGELDSTRTLLYAKSVSDKLAFDINSIFLAGNGVTKTILLQSTLKDDTNYDLNIYPTEHLIKINWNNRQYSSTLLTSSLSGALTSLQGEYDIANVDGIITIASLAPQICGNNIIEGTEVCDGTDLSPYNSDCSTYPPYTGGTLSCLGDCSDYDTSSCTLPVTCQSACSTLGYGQSQCRNGCSGGWSTSALLGDAECTAQNPAKPDCCCR